MAGFAQHRQTKSQNALAFTMWLTGCTDEALTRADPLSIARSYGLAPADASHAINRERLRRSAR